MSFANNTPIQYLPGIGWRTANVLNDLGVHTAGQLHRIPESVLVELFGPSIRTITRNVQISNVDLARSESNRFAARTQKQDDEAFTEHKMPFGKRLRLATQFLSVL